MPNYIRARVPGGTYFFTVVLQDRSQSFLTAHIQRLRASFRAERQRRPFKLDAIVVLPDHLHCLWTLPEGDDDFSTRWRAIKAAFAHSIEAQVPGPVRQQRKRERGVWQRRFWEHLIRDEEDFARHADYIHYNPVKHGYVQSPAQWPWSSFHRFVERGTYPPDWAAAEAVRRMSRE